MLKSGSFDGSGVSETSGVGSGVAEAKGVCTSGVGDSDAVGVDVGVGVPGFCCVLFLSELSAKITIPSMTKTVRKIPIITFNLLSIVFLSFLLILDALSSCIAFIKGMLFAVYDTQVV